MMESIRRHLSIAVPVIFAFFMRKSVDIVSVMFVGHLSAQDLSAAGLATVTANVSGNSMIIGVAGALSTLCSQAYGAKNYKELGLALQRGILIFMIFLCLPISILWLYSAQLMMVLNISADIAQPAGMYLSALIPGLWTASWSWALRSWMYAQEETNIYAVISLITALVHPILCYLFIYVFNMGFLGAAYAISATRTLELLMVLGYVVCFSSLLYDTKFKLSRKAFKNWLPFLKLVGPSLMMMAEWWASEMVIFMAGYLEDAEDEVAAMSIYQNILSICFMFPSGFRVSGETVVGNALGAGHTEEARVASHIAPGLAGLLSVLISALLIIYRNKVGGMFTQDSNVVAMVARIMPLLTVYVIADGVQTALSGIIKGMGRQRVAGPIVLFAYYVIGVPLSAYLAFPHWGRGMGIVGLCMGTFVGTFVHMLLYMYVVYFRTDWVHETEVVVKRLAAGSSGSSSSIRASSSTAVSGDGSAGGSSGDSAKDEYYNSNSDSDDDDDDDDDDADIVINFQDTAEHGIMASSTATGKGGAAGAVSSSSSLPTNNITNKLRALIGLVPLSLSRGKEGKKSEYELVRQITNPLDISRSGLDSDEDDDISIMSEDLAEGDW